MKPKKMIFGAAYYPEYMPYERVETDFEMMRRAGMNTVRIAESTWSFLEPEEGRFDFCQIDHVLECAEKYGMNVIVGTPTYAIPSWMAKKHPEIMVLQKSGQARYGHRQLMDITNKDFLRYAERVIRRLVTHVAEHTCVIGYQIDNETKHYDVYSSQVQRRFVERLKEKYQTTDALNRAFYLSYWSNSIGCWEDFPDMRGCIHGGLCVEFDAFRRSLVTEYLGWQAGIVRECAGKNQFVTHNLDFSWKKFGADIAQDGYSYGVQPDAYHPGIADCLDIAGCDIYHPTQDALTGAEIAFGGDEIRPLKERNYLVLENQAQAFKYWTPYPGQIRLHAYSHLASGAAGSMYWNWHSIHNGYETYWKGVLSHDLESNPVYEEAGETGREWQTIGGESLTIRKENRIALVIDNRSLTALEWFPADRDLSYNDVVRHVYDCLYEMNLECDVVHADRLEAEHYKMIVTPALYCAGEALLEELKRFVENGGILVSSFRSFVADENAGVYADRQPHMLSECFGMHYQQFTEPVNMTVSGHPVSYWADLAVADTAAVLAAYEHPYWNRYAAITEHAFGAGRAYYIACFTEKQVFREVLQKAADSAGIKAPAYKWPVIERSGVNFHGKKVHYILHYSGENTSVKCRFEKVRDIRTGNTYQKGEAVSLNGWDVAVLEEIE